MDAPMLRRLPKAELHLHIEGTLEPEMLLELARQNRVALPYPDIESIRRAYVFDDLQSFLDIYYLACRVLLTEEDFFALTWAYLERAHRDGVRHVEMFFDPQTHTDRGVAFGTVVSGIGRALDLARERWSLTSRLIMCFLRHQSLAEAESTLDQGLEHRDLISAVGLDSSEQGHPPRDFVPVFDRARRNGLEAVAHAGEEGPPSYIWEALDLLHVRRIDHGVRCLEDERLVERLVREQIPLTVCPLSNVRLRVVERLEAHPLATLLDRGVCVTVNSDDPAYFGGYVADNLIAATAALSLDDDQVRRLCRNSIEASMLEPDERQRLQDELTAVASAVQQQP